MKAKYISKSNATFQVFESIKRSRKKRSEHKKFLVEGVRPINVLKDNGWDIIDIIFPANNNLSHWALSVIKENEQAEIYQLAPELYLELTDRDNPTELMVTVKARQHTLPTAKVTDSDVFLVLDRIKTPGNLGSIIRSANATGVRGIGVIGHSADVFDPQSVRASLGACFEIPFEYFESNDDLKEWLDTLKATNEVELVATSAKAEKSIYDFKKSTTTVLLIGSESKGLSPFLSDLADTNLSLPMSGTVSSLNVASATTAILYVIKAK